MFAPWHDTDYHPHDCECDYHKELNRKNKEVRDSMTSYDYGKGISLKFPIDRKGHKFIKAMLKHFKREVE